MVFCKLVTQLLFGLIFKSPPSRLPQISDALSFVKEILQQLTNQRASIEEDIQSSFEDLHKQLDVRKSVLLMELEVTYGLKQKVQTYQNKMVDKLVLSILFFMLVKVQPNVLLG